VTPTDDKLSLVGAWSLVRSCDPLQNFLAPVISLEWERLHTVVKLCEQVGYINSSNMMTSPTKGAWLLPFVVMQRVARVCQQQLSYLFKYRLPQNDHQFSDQANRLCLVIHEKAATIHTYHSHLFLILCSKANNLFTASRKLAFVKI